MPDDSRVAPYVPFKTFLNSVDYLRQRVLPPEINRTVWQSFSGTTIGLLMGTYKFLGLTDEKGQPSRNLRNLIDFPDRQRSELNKVLQQAYPELIALGLSNATPKHVFEIFSDHYGVSGATQQKAISFFIQAATHAELSLSPYLTKRKGRKRRTNSRRVGGSNAEAVTHDHSASVTAATGTTRSIQLESGGEVMLSVRFDAFSISAEDRKFVFSLIDQLAGYEKAVKRSGSLMRRDIVAAAQPANQEDVGDDDVPF